MNLNKTNQLYRSLLMDY